MNFKNIFIVLSLAFVGGLCAGQAHSGSLETHTWRADIPAITGSCELRALFNQGERTVYFIADWESRTRFAGFWPNQEGDYAWKRMSNQSELAEELETLTITFKADANGNMQPVTYVYEDNAKSRIGIAPRTCPALKKIN